MSESALAPGTVLAGKFRVLSLLGEGGMGAVYQIEHEITKHRRALKLLHSSMAELPSVVERFLREASAAGRVGNPHIVETFDAGRLDTGEPYLVMEMLRGEPLSSRIARGPLPVAEVIDLVGQACGGVQAAHDAGIVHRDLKPDNLFITEAQDGRPFIKILDFGISKFDSAKTGGFQLTQEGAALGTPYYMPPEQIRGEVSLDARADVYALGVILYECLAGVRPFEAETLPHLAILIHTGDPKPIGQLRPDLPAGLAEVVHGAMTADRTKRIQTAAELRTALEQFGGIGFRTRIPGSSVAPMSMAPARSIAPPPLATSGAGVSMGAAPSAEPKKQSPVLLVIGGATLVVAGAIGTGLWLHARSAPLEVASAAPIPPPGPTAASSSAQANVSGAPQIGSQNVVAPSASDKAPSPSVAPALVDPRFALAAPSASAAPRAGQSGLGSGPPHGAAPRGRADERGLAQSNPFK
ncbi:MAG TPA: protein kinase [Polyangiaceae bacterium]|jgi:serine/threonine-protein kinase|nr:protein kinase [Polyangiaceae bacterium]